MMMLISLMRARALEGSAASKMVLPFGRNGHPTDKSRAG